MGFNDPVEIVDLPSYKMVDLSIAMLNYQRVHIKFKPYTDEYPVHPQITYFSFWTQKKHL